MGVVGRLDQYASTLAWEFDETTANNPSITGLGTYYASEFNENVVETTIVTSGLVLNLDAGNTASYPGSGDNLVVEYLVVAGGGAGGPTYHGAGGGAGGYRSSVVGEMSGGGSIADPRLTLNIGSYQVTIGSGGIGGVNNGDGANSTFSTIISIGGGGGNSRNGGSGSGTSYGSPTVGLGIVNQGYNGGTGASPAPPNYGSGGGGGAGGVGQTGTSTTGGAGGAGALSSITGISTYYAGGGGGSTYNGGTPGQGNAGGGNGSNGQGTSASANSGSGGGGSERSAGIIQGGNGGSGIVIVRYLGAQRATGGTVTSSGGYTIHTFTTVGLSTFVVNPTTIWTDISGNGNNGTLTNGPTYSSANGGSIVFDGVDDEVTTTTQFTNPQTFSIGAWFKTSSASGKKIIGFEANQTGTASGSYDRQIYIGSDGKLYFGLYDGAIRFAISPLTYADNNWHYVVGTYGSEGTTLRLYVDGVSVATATASFAQNINGYWRIAGYRTNAWTNAGDGYFTGSISVAQVYNKALSAAEISQNYNTFAPRFGLSLTVPFLSANVLSPYDLLYDDFGGTLFGAGQGRYMRQNTDKSAIVYNEIDEVTDLFGRGIVRDGLVLDLDAGNTNSYSSDNTENLLLYSEQFDNASGWAFGGGISISANTTTAPDGTLTADTATITAAGSHFLRQQVSVTQSTQYTFSFYVKRGTATNLSYSVYNYTTNSEFISPTSYYSQTSATDWVRISLIFTTPAGCTSIGVYPFRDGAATGTAFVWGAQLERGSSASQYYLTTTTQKIKPNTWTTWTDLSPYGNNGTLTNGPTYNGANYGSIGFDGSNDYVSTGPSSNLAFGSGNFTISSWIYQTITTFNLIASSRVVSSGNNLYWDFYTLNGQLAFQTRTSGGTEYTALSNASSISTNQWYNVAAVRLNNVITVYVNGIAGSTTVNDGGNNLTEQYIGLGIFNYPGFVYYYSGNIANFSFYKNRALSAAEITQNFDALRGRYGLSAQPVASITGSTTSVNEGSSVTFSVASNQFASTLYWTTNAVSGTINSSDFIVGGVSGSFSADGAGSGSVGLTLANDATVEGTESFQLQVRTGSTSGTIIATSPTISINDTSTVAYVTPSTTSLVSEGSTVTFDVVSGISSTTLYWTLNTISGTINTSDFTGAAVSGSFSTDGGGRGSVALTLANDLATEGTESFQLQVRTVSTSGTIIATSPTISINDTSSSSIVTSGLVLNLDAGNIASYGGSGTTWTDVSGNGRNFTWSSTPSFTSIGSSSYFSTSGSGSCLGPASNSFGIDNTSGYTIFVICKQNSFTSTSAFNFNGSVAYGRGIFAHLTWNDGSVYFDQGGCCGGDTRTYVASGGASTWNIWVFRRLSNSSERSIIKNETTLTTNTAGAANINLDATQAYVAGGGWDVQLNSFIVYNRGLSNAEISQNYNALRDRFGI